MMRAFSSSPHGLLIGPGDRVTVQIRMSRANLALLVALVLAGGVFLGGVGASLRGPEATPEQPPAIGTPAATTSVRLPAADVDGADIDRLPRYPGSVRTAHEVVREDRYRLTATEYQAEATVDDVRTFYQGIIVDYEWERADINFDHGEWSYVLVDGSVEALVEIEQFGGLVEIDLQISEPIATPQPSPAPTAPAPTVAPTAPPPPPPPGDDDDDDGGDDSDDGDGGTDDD